MNRLRIAVIGLRFGMAHVEGARDCGAEIAAICDLDRENLDFAGERYGIPYEKRFTDYRDLLNRDDLDAVVIAVPDQGHRELSAAFLHAGKHVLCEKPMALTREDAREMIRVSRSSGRQLMVGQICRFTPAFQKAKALVDEGVLGDLYFLESEYAHDYMKIVDNWRADPLRHGVIGGGCHAVDLLRWLGGDPKEVFAYGTKRLLPQVPYDDATVAVLKFDDKTMGKVFVSTGCKRDYTMRTVLYGTRGTLICDNTSPTMTLFTVGEDGMAHEPRRIPVEVNNHNAKLEFEAFSEAICAGTPVPTPAVEGAKTVEVCLSIIESAKTGKPVRPDYRF